MTTAAGPPQAGGKPPNTTPSPGPPGHNGPPAGGMPGIENL